MIRRTLAAALSALVVTTGLLAITSAPALAVGGWQIRNILSGRCIAPVNNTTANNAHVVLSNAPCATTWNFISDNFSGTIKSIHLDANPSRCLVPSGSSQLNNVAIVIGACDPSNPQTNAALLWTLDGPKTTVNGHDYYQLRNYWTNKCFLPAGDSTSAGAAILQFTCNTNQGELFTW